MGKKPKRFTPEVVGLLEGYPWPGNIRELENVIERIVAIEDRETVTVNCLPQEIVSPQKQKLETQELFAPGFSLTHHLDEITKKYIHEALAAHRRQPAEGRACSWASATGPSATSSASTTSTRSARPRSVTATATGIPSERQKVSKMTKIGVNFSAGLRTIIVYYCI